MENAESITAAPIFREVIELESKEYNLTANDNNNYELKMKAFNNDKISFNIHQINKITNLSYESTFTYEAIAKILFLERTFYNNIQKVFKFCDTALSKGKVQIIPEIKTSKRIKFLLKKSMDFDEVICQFYLNEKINTKDEIIQTLIEEINKMKKEKPNNNIKTNNDNVIDHSNNIGNNNIIINELNEKINKLAEKNELYEAQLYSIVEENTFLRNKITDMENKFKELEFKISQINLNNNNDNNNNIIKSPPEISSLTYNNINKSKAPIKLEMKEVLTDHHSNSGYLRQFVVYTSKIDNFEYLAYNNKSNFNIDIIRINNKQLIRYLKGHKAKVSVLKYFTKNNQGYLLSCDEKKLAICWDLSTFNQQFRIKINIEGYIWDALVLLNVRGNDLCIFPSNSDREFTKIYNLNGKNELIKEIYGTYENKTNFLIPWIYNNNYYLIELCSSKISINNILINENYANLIKSPEGLHCSGYIFKDIFLCVTDYQNNFVRIWNLEKKFVEREIKFDGFNCYGIIPWNNDYSLIACSDGLIIIDMNEGIMAKKIVNSKAFNLCGLQKINSAYYGECVICSNSNGHIMLFNEQ